MLVGLTVCGRSCV